MAVDHSVAQQQGTVSRVTTQAIGLKIKLDDLTGPQTPYYIKDRPRLASATSVKLLDPETLVCASLLGRKLYLVRIDLERQTHHILDVVETVFDGQTVETDLCDADPAGVNLVVTNFLLGTLSHYRRAGERLEFVGDLPFKIDSFVHGIKFFRPEIVATTATKGPTGVHFFNIETSQAVLHVATPVKSQDIAFLSERQLVLIATHGAPRAKPGPMYDSEAHLIDFDLERGTFSLAAKALFKDAHFDSAVAHNGNVYVTDQFNHRVIVLDPRTLETIQQIDGFDFPHGIDIRYGLLAVTNYGSNCIDVRPM